MSRVVVIGVGNAQRGDDAVGLAVAAEVRRRAPAGVEIVECEQEPTRLIDVWDGADAAIVVDACHSGAPAGAVSRFDASRGGLPARTFRSSTHAFGVGDAVELARALGRLPAHVIVFGVEGADFAAGSGLSPEVAAAVGGVADAVVAELEGAACTSAR